jgi:hypothetical protein
MEGPPNYLMALEHYNRAIQLKPNLAEAYEYRGMLLLKIDRKSAGGYRARPSRVAFGSFRIGIITKGRDRHPNVIH